jgi:hypothetical protein
VEGGRGSEVEGGMRKAVRWSEEEAVRWRRWSQIHRDEVHGGEAIYVVSGDEVF